MGSFLSEGMELFKKHYKEISANLDIPLDIDRQKYIALAEAGNLKVFSARDKGKLVGYGVFLVSKNIRYQSSIQAIQDVFYIHPDYRGNNGEFLLWCDEQLKKMDVQLVLHHVKVKHDWGHLLERNGYKQIEKIYSRRLDHG